MGKNIISAIIPCYNSEDYIVEAIESVLNQTFLPYIKEIIVIDDGSEDSTRQVVNRYTDKNFVEYFYQDNQGPAAARNKGIEKADGEYVAFLDSDDIWTDNKIEEDVKYLRTNPKCKLVFSNVIVVDKDLKKIYKNNNDIPNGKKEAIKELYLGNINMNTPTIVAQKEAVTDIEGFCEDMPHREDHYFLMQMVEKFEVGFISKHNVLRRVREGSLSYQQNNELEEPLIRLKNYRPFLEKCINEYPYLKNFEGIVMSQLYLEVAIRYLKKGKRLNCFKYLFNSVMLNPKNFKSYLILAASCVPIKFNSLKKLWNSGNINTN